MPSALGYLALGDVEIANVQRTLTYLRRGLAGPTVEGWTAAVLTPEGPGYEDVYSDIYTPDLYWPGNLACYCALLGDGPFVSPAEDPAPWYDPDRPESADFLGLVVDISMPTPLRRTSRGRAGGGAVLGTQGIGGRLLQVDGIMYAASLPGMHYGERWLSQVLSTELGSCELANARILPFCPPEGVEEPASYWRRLADVGLVDGPVFGSPSNVPACTLQTVSFQLLSSRPWLLTEPTECVAETYLTADPTHCCEVEATGPGRAAARITLRSGAVGSSMRDVVLRFSEDPSSCPAPSDEVESEITVAYVPRNNDLIIDAAERTVVLLDNETGARSTAMEWLSFDGLFQWPEAAPGEVVCVCVDATGAALNPGSSVAIEVVEMEL